MQLTKRQHNVPAFYLRQWSSTDSGKIICHDLDEERIFETSPNGILARRYFYEENPDKPDNRVERLLSDMESACAIHFSALNRLGIDSTTRSSVDDRLSLVRKAFSTDVCKAIKMFAAYQYLRVPGAIEQKRDELKGSDLTPTEQNYFLNAGRFVESGFTYIEERFESMKLFVFMSTGQDFLTSDWPCFDLKYSEFSHLIGEEIGVNSEVVAYLPLTRRLGVVFYPQHHLPQSRSQLTPEVHILAGVDSFVRNQNTLVIQQCGRYVVANRASDFIFKVAKKRKKNKNHDMQKTKPPN